MTGWPSPVCNGRARISIIPARRTCMRDFPQGQGTAAGIEHEAPTELTSEEYPILLTTGRMLYHYNVSTRQSATLESLAPEELAEINPADAEAIGLADGGRMRVSSRRGSVLTGVKLTNRVPPGILFMTFHYWETAVNELTNSAYDPISKTAGIQGLRGQDRESLSYTRERTKINGKANDMSLIKPLKHERHKPANANEKHKSRLGMQDRIALLVTTAIGTMYAVYLPFSWRVG